MRNLGVAITVLAADRAGDARQASALAQRIGLFSVSRARAEVELPARQRAGGTMRAADLAGATVAGCTAGLRLARLERSIGQHQRTIGEPGAPLMVDADPQRGRMMPSGQITQTLQADCRRAGIEDFKTLLRQALRKAMSPLSSGVYLSY